MVSSPWQRGLADRQSVSQEWGGGTDCSSGQTLCKGNGSVQVCTLAAGHLPAFNCLSAKLAMVPVVRAATLTWQPWMSLWPASLCVPCSWPARFDGPLCSFLSAAGSTWAWER